MNNLNKFKTIIIGYVHSIDFIKSYKLKDFEFIYKQLSQSYETYNKTDTYFDVNYRSLNLEILNYGKLKIGRVRTYYNDDWIYLKQRGAV